MFQFAKIMIYKQIIALWTKKKVKASQLGHDSHGTYVGPWDPKDPNTWHDVMGYEYRRCNSCGRFLPVSCFPPSVRNPSERLRSCAVCTPRRKISAKIAAAVKREERENPGEDHETIQARRDKETEAFYANIAKQPHYLRNLFPHIATRDLMKELERRGFVRATSYNSTKYPEEDITLTVTLTHTNFTNLNELV